MNNTRSFNPESKFIPVDFQIARLLDYEKMEADGLLNLSWETPLVCDEENRYFSNIDQCFNQSGSHADGIWNMINQYEEDITDDDIVIEEVENPSFTEAQKLGAKALFMAFVYYMGKADNYAKARNRVDEIYSQPHLKPDTTNPYDWFRG